MFVLCRGKVCVCQKPTQEMDPDDYPQLGGDQQDERMDQPSG